MLTLLQKYLLQHLTPSFIDSSEYDRWMLRIKQEKLIREENPLSHCCAMFITFNPHSKKVFVIHHKKARSWIFPGGHIDRGELPPATLAREAREELGLKVNESDFLGPFGAHVLDIDNPPQVCREHYDIFYALEMPDQQMNIDMREFLDFGWFSIDEAMKKIETEYYRQSLRKFVAFMKW